MQPLQKKSIFIGFLVDIGVTIGVLFILGLVMGFMGFDQTALEGTSAEIIQFILACMATIIGGFVASIRAKFRHIAHGAWVGGIGVILGVMSFPFIFMAYLNTGNAIPTITIIISVSSLIMSVPLGMIGGFLGRKYDTPVNVEKIKQNA